MTPAFTTRRQMLQTVSAGFGYVALAGLTTRAAASEAKAVNPLAARPPHFTPKAKRVVYLCMRGGPSHVDTFDYKPKLADDAGKAGGGDDRKARKLLPSPFKFAQRGQSGLWMSELFPELAAHADDLCLLNSMHTDVPNHPQAFLMMHTGQFRVARPSIGSWLLYGLGTENQDLPGFVTICPPNDLGGAQNYSSAFLPAVYQGTRIGTQGQNVAEARIGNIAGGPLPTDLQRKQVDLVQELNRGRLTAKGGDSPELEGVIESMELAFRMQRAVPEVLDLSKESRQTLAAYGIGAGMGGGTENFGRQCLMARRLLEAGVRYVEVSHGNWDQHNNLRKNLSGNCLAVDRPAAALLADLKARDMLKDTLVIWGGEFGRTPGAQNNDGRDHNAAGFTVWLAGGGVKGGIRYGATDDHGVAAVTDKTHVHDLHATILHLMGLDHEKLTYRYGGRDYRLTDVHGEVADGILA